jgi:hypothetical protein
MWKWLAILAVSASPDGPGFGLSVGGSGAAQQQQQPSPPPPPPRPPPPANVCQQRRVPDRTCSTDADCAIVRVHLSCCGTESVNGINRADLEAFQAYQRQCARGRACGCAAGPTRLDDGSRLERNEPVLVACRANLCTTYLAPPAKLTSDSVQQLSGCPAAACGPAPLYPTAECGDGVSVSGRGPCVRIGGRCRWVRLECP